LQSHHQTEPDSSAREIRYNTDIIVGFADVATRAAAAQDIGSVEDTFSSSKLSRPGMSREARVARESAGVYYYPF